MRADEARQLGDRLREQRPAAAGVRRGPKCTVKASRPLSATTGTTSAPVRRASAISPDASRTGSSNGCTVSARPATLPGTSIGV